MQYKDKFFLNNNGYFVAPTVDIRPQINYEGKITPAKEIYVNADIPSGSFADGQSPFPSQVRQVWAKEANTSKLVWPHTSTFMINNGAHSRFGVDGDGPARYGGVAHFTVKKSDNTSNYICFPTGWTGRISYWVGNKSITTSPSNAAVSNEQWFTDHGAYHQFNFWGGDDSGGIAENGRSSGEITKDGWMEYGRNTPTKKMVIAPHTVTLANKTNFTFNGYYNQSTPLTRPWFGFTVEGDGGGGDGNHFDLQEYQNLMIAVTTTSGIKPVVLPVFKGNLTDAELYAETGVAFNNKFVAIRLFNGLLRFGNPNAWRVTLIQNEKMNGSNDFWTIGVRFDGIHFDADTESVWKPRVTIGGVHHAHDQIGNAIFISVSLPKPNDSRWITVKSVTRGLNRVVGYRYMTLPLNIIDPQGISVLSLSNATNISLPMEVFIKVAENYT